MALPMASLQMQCLRCVSPKMQLLGVVGSCVSPFIRCPPPLFPRMCWPSCNKPSPLGLKRLVASLKFNRFVLKGKFWFQLLPRTLAPRAMSPWSFAGFGLRGCCTEADTGRHPIRAGAHFGGGGLGGEGFLGRAGGLFVISGLRFGVWCLGFRVRGCVWFVAALGFDGFRACM